MARRNREINIFNMSLLDILCGALGAFCFMMIALLPYYKPPQEMAKLQQSQREMDDLMKQLDQMKNQATDPQAAQQMQQAMAQLQQRVQEMEGQLNDAMQQNQQLTQQNDQLNKDNQTLKIRQPFTVTVSSSVLEENVDLYLQDDVQSKTTCPPFDPTNAHNSTFWPGDHHIYGAAFATWIVRDSPEGVHYKLYARLTNDIGQRQACTVSTLVVSDGPDVAVPTVNLTPERPWELAGTLTVGKNNALSYKEATQAERDAEWQKLPKETPPPKTTPTATPTPTATASATPSATATPAATGSAKAHASAPPKHRFPF